MTITLQATIRTERGKQLETLRRDGKLPAVVYGPKEPATALTIERGEFEKILKEAGESSIITLKGLDANKDVLVHEVAFDPLRGGITHVDFYAIEAGKNITVHVPFTFIGEAPALKLGGTLTKVLHEVEITCAPSKLPKEIVVDISSLTEFDSQIHVKDITFPDGVTVENDPQDMVVLVQTVAEEVAEPVAVDMDAIEVEKKGKTETEEAA